MLSSCLYWQYVKTECPCTHSGLCGSRYDQDMKTSRIISRIAVAAAALIAAFVLAACAVTVTDGSTSVRGSVHTQVSGRIHLSFPLSTVITRFEPTRGGGAYYYVGDPIEFRVRATRNGYVTLTYLDAGGNVNVFARNIYVQGGRENIITGPDSGHSFNVGFPRGIMLIRAAFTPEPTNPARVTYSGVSGQSGWTNRIELDLGGGSYVDLMQTSIDVR